MRLAVNTLLLASLLLNACASGGVDDGEVSETTQSVTTQNKIALNKIALNKIALNQIALNKLALSDNADDLIATADGRDVLAYTLGCALPASVTLVGTYAGVTYEFSGDIGLAPTWTQHALTLRDQHWVSACLLARVNAHNISLLISLRGPATALTVSASEASAYTLQEAAFYGQLFVPDGTDLQAYACMGAAQAAGEPETGELHDRDCSEPDLERPGVTQCGMTYVGPCANFAQDPDGDDDERCNGHDPGIACEDHSWLGYFKDCHTQASDANGRWPRHTELDEVITVYLQN